MSKTNLSELDSLHHEWAGVHSRLRDLEEQLSAAIARYARGVGPRPVELIAEVEALRAQCAQKFQALMARVRSAPADGTA